MRTIHDKRQFDRMEHQATGRAPSCSRRNEARRIAANIAKLPDYCAERN
jgi:hypothetical protein